MAKIRQENNGEVNFKRLKPKKMLIPNKFDRINKIAIIITKI